MEINLSEIEPIAEKILQMYRDELDRQGINASSKLSQSAAAIVELNGTRLQISLNLEPYWRYVEYGRRPGKMPPIDAIAEWIRIKPVIPNPVNGRVPDTRSLAFLIARKIGREGIPDRKPLTNVMYSNGVESLIQDIKSILTKQLKKKLENEI